MENEQDMIEFQIKIEKLKKLQDEKSVVKCKMLLEDDVLRKLYKTLVLEKKSMTDEEFWKDREMIKYFDRLAEAKNQTLGKSTKMIFETKTSFKKEMKNNQEITPGMISELNELMRREKRLFELYKTKVLVEHMSEKKFWEDFLNKQRENKTIVFGELNPIFIDDDMAEEKVGNEKIDKEVDLLLNFDAKDERYLGFQKDLSDGSAKKKELNPIECFNKRSYKILEEELNSKVRKLNEFDDNLITNEGLTINDLNKIETEMKSLMEIELEKKKRKMNNRENPKELKKDSHFHLEKKMENWIAFKTRINNFSSSDLKVKKCEVLKDYHKRITEETQVYNNNRSNTSNYSNEGIISLQHFNKQANELLSFFYKVFYKNEKEFNPERPKATILNEIEELLKDLVVQMEKQDNKNSNVPRNLEKSIDHEKDWSIQIRHSMKNDIENRINQALAKNQKKDFVVNFDFNKKGKAN